MNEPGWALVIAASGERQLARLPERVAVAIVGFALGPLSENPHGVGHGLQRELAGLWSARGGAYRLVYEIDEDRGMVVVLRIDHRADVYRTR